MNAPAQPRDWLWLRRAILLFAVAAPVFAAVMIRHNVFLALAPLFLSHVGLLYPTLNPHCQWWGPVIRSFATTEKQVWLTIDDGPSAGTIQMLDLLDRFDARATFFVIGDRVATHGSIRDEIVTRGHQLANHTFTHPSAYFWCSPPAAIRREITRCSATLPAGTLPMFRAPVGIKNFFLHPVLRELGHHCIGWTTRGFDTVFRNPAHVAQRICANMAPGAIILLHERKSRVGTGDFHSRCLEAVLQQLTNAGYRCVLPTLDQLSVSTPLTK